MAKYYICAVCGNEMHGGDVASKEALRIILLNEKTYFQGNARKIRFILKSH